MHYRLDDYTGSCTNYMTLQNLLQEDDPVSLQELTAGFQDTCIYHFGEWWRYELCIGGTVCCPPGSALRIESVKLQCSSWHRAEIALPQYARSIGALQVESGGQTEMLS